MVCFAVMRQNYVFSHRAGETNKSLLLAALFPELQAFPNLD